MAHVTPKDRRDLPTIKPVLDGAEAVMGFVPNSMLTMAHMAQLPVAFSILTSVVFGGDLKAVLAQYETAVPDQEDAESNLPPELVQLVAFSSSVSAGCRYCQAHTSHNAHRWGASQEKLDDILNFATSDHYSAAEKAAVALALAAGAVPNEARASHFDALREHFTDRQIVQIVGVIAMFGFLNRWNDTMATQLEAQPVDWAQSALGSIDWAVEKHA